jgi:hypothetical protein
MIDMISLSSIPYSLPPLTSSYSVLFGHSYIQISFFISNLYYERTSTHPQTVSFPHTYYFRTFFPRRSPKPTSIPYLLPISIIPPRLVSMQTPTYPPPTSFFISLDHIIPHSELPCVFFVPILSFFFFLECYPFYLARKRAHFKSVCFI